MIFSPKYGNILLLEIRGLRNHIAPVGEVGCTIDCFWFTLEHLGDLNQSQPINLLHDYDYDYVPTSGDFTDLYDDKGNPLYESTDSEASDAESTVVEQ